MVLRIISIEVSNIYHIYPLGLCGAPEYNQVNSQVVHRIEKLYRWLDHLQYLGVDTVYIGPIFESISHGYDTTDYYHIDKRLGDRQSFARLVHAFHERGIKVIVDAVFNHVGRNFWAFKDVLYRGRHSWYCDWFQGLNFNKKSPFGDPFTYKSWKGHYSLVKLNLRNKYVKEHLIKAVDMWIDELGIDGLRVDAADCIKVDFIRALSKHAKKRKKGFFLVGEVVHGNYHKWVNHRMFDSVTNYQSHHELYSSFNNKNMFEVASAMKRQFGDHGEYKNLRLYNFVDNHDVNRVASLLNNQAHLYPIYALLFTIPGIPNIYYGSEWGIKGKRNRHSDRPLRPEIHLNEVSKRNKNKDLVHSIARFAKIRNHSSALKYGNYKELYVLAEQLIFSRRSHDEYIIVAINSSEHQAYIEFDTQDIQNGILQDLLEPDHLFQINQGKVGVNIFPNWCRILVLRKFFN